MQPFWHLVRRVIAQEGGNLCVISVRLETFAKHPKVTQPEARNPTEKNREEQLVPATRAVRGFNTSHMHAAQVQICKVKSCRVEGCATETYSLAGTIGSQFFLCVFVFYPNISMTPKVKSIFSGGAFIHVPFRDISALQSKLHGLIHKHNSKKM